MCDRFEALCRDIARRLRLGNLDEARVIDALLVRLEIGRERYGHLDLRKARDWDREEAEELLDMRIYQACRTLVERDAAMSREFDLSDAGEG